MLNYVSKNTGTDELASRMSQMELKLNRLVEQQILLLKGMANDQFKLTEGQVKPVSSGTALEEQVNEQSSSQGKKTTKKPTKLLKDIQEEHQTEINSPLYTQNDLQVMDRSPSQKRREFQNVNTDTVPVLASPEDVEMDVLDGEKDLSEVVIEHGNLNHSLSGSTKDFKF